MTKVIIPNDYSKDKLGKKQKKTDVDSKDYSEELTGQLESQEKQDKLMHSVLENDKETIDEGRLLNDSINQGVGSFTPDLMFDQIVKNYKMAEQLYGETMIRELCGYDPSYVQKNINIPEFQREIKQKVKDKIEKMRKEGLLDKDGSITETGLELASVVMYVEELDKLEPIGFYGEKVNRKRNVNGVSDESRFYKKGDRYKDIDIKKSIKTAVRRSHKKIISEDLKVFDKKNKAHIYIIYGLDASGSMKGKKISLSKKAGIALAYKAISEKDKVGLIAFGSDIKKKVKPTNNFMQILKAITEIRASMETNIKDTISEAVDMFSTTDSATKHLILLTDALPTTGKDPEREVLDEAAKAKNSGITISVIGINLDRKGKKLAERVTEIGSGKLYVLKDFEELDKIVLEDYYSL